ncbi:MAG: PepSY domain-containing protein [Burkholderiales bacterium]|nr:PepSY domain-containing protein [Burkholderiales bacterium]
MPTRTAPAARPNTQQSVDERDRGFMVGFIPLADEWQMNAAFSFDSPAVFNNAAGPRKGAIMKPRQSIAPILVALTLGAIALPTLASDDCEVPLERWQSRDAVRQMAARKGWDLQRLKIDDGATEVRAMPPGAASKPLDPETLEPVKMKLRERRPDRAHERRRDRTPAAQDVAPGAGPAGSNSLPAPGSRPRGQIE